MMAGVPFKKGLLSLKVEVLFVPTVLTAKFPPQPLHGCPNCVSVNPRTLPASTGQLWSYTHVSRCLVQQGPGPPH